MAISREDLEALCAVDIATPIPSSTLLPVLTTPPFIPSQSLINLRDLGLVPGSALRPGRFFRSGTLEFASADPAATAWLSGNVKRVFDLRRGPERDKAPSPAIDGVENVWLDQDGTYRVLDLEAFVDGLGVEAWAEQYMIVVDVYKPSIRAVLEHVRDRPTEPFLFHCTAGRDRTGVVAGLFQTLAGSPPETTVLDFMLSRIGTEPAREKLVKYAMSTVGTIDMDAPGFHNMISLRPGSWEAFLAALRKKYGDWDGYVTKGLGFSEEDLEKIKTNLRG